MYVPPLTTATKSMSTPFLPTGSNRSTRTVRGSARSVSPRRAASYSLRPPTFTALNAGGRWDDSPSLAVIARATSSSVTATADSRVTAPSASSVSVWIPSRNVPS